MRQFISKNFFNLLVIALVCVLIIQRCGEDGNRIDTSTAIKIDTIWVVKDSVVYAKPSILYGRRDTVWENTKEYIASTDVKELKKQFDLMKQEFFSKNTYSDTLKMGDSSYVAVKDEIQRNQISDRQYTYKLKYPSITRTITTTNHVYDGKQIYIGGGIGGNKENLVNTANLGILYKDKKDRIFGLGVQKTFAPDIPLTYGVSSYWKIKAKH